MKNLALVALVLLAQAASLAQACGPFDYRVTRTTAPREAMRGQQDVPTGTAAPALAWAREVATDARTVHSDVAFLTTPGSVWGYAPEDSALSKANTLLEMYGYFSAVLTAAGKPPALAVDDARNRVLDSKNADAFSGLSVNILRAYPNDENAKMVETAVNQVFEGTSAQVLEEMKNQNHNPAEFGVKYFTRPAFLDSEASPGIAGPCMAIAYGQDYFTNGKTDEATLRPIFGIAIRSSIVDYAAAQALRQLDTSTGKLKERSFKIAGKIECSLAPPPGFQLSVLRTRCGSAPNEKFFQSNPVVRDVGGQERFVQAGMELFRVSCKDSLGNSIPVSSGDVSWQQSQKLFSDMMALGAGSGTPAEVTGPVAAAAAILGNLPPHDLASAKTSVLEASNVCASYLEKTVLKKGGPTGAPAPAVPGEDAKKGI